MNRCAPWLLLLALFCGAASAITYRSEGLDNFTHLNTAAGVASWCEEGAGEEYTAGGVESSQSAIMTAGVPGTSFYITCGGSGLENVQITGYVVATCNAGIGGSLTMLQTITAIDQYGQTTTGPTVVNPQCQDGCVVEHPTGAGAMTCSLYLNPTQVREVGADGWTVCSGEPIARTGVTCNITGSELTEVTPMVAMPLGYELDAGPGDEEEDEGEGPNATGFRVDDNAYCNDANGDGKEDGTEEACSQRAADQLAGIRANKQAQFDAIGNGGSIATAANYNGGWLGLPAAIMSFLNPPPVCSYVFKLPKYTMLGENFEVTANGWCAVKTEIEPYIAFLMWVFTCLFLVGQFRKV